jgi:RNA polymerase sigma-70 factor (family 1)
LNEYTTYSDEQLVQFFKANDDRAFNEIYNRYWERLLVLACSKLSSQDDAQEVVQQVFVDLWIRRSALFLQFSFATYITAAVRYRILKYSAKQTNQLIKHSALPINAEDNSTEQWLSFEELKDQLGKHVQELPEKCRLVFVLSREAGLTEKQIAEQLKISTKTVEAHLSKAKHSLRISLRNFFSVIFLS